MPHLWVFVIPKKVRPELFVFRLMQPHLIVRADANAKIGTGHLMRCLALAQSWRTRGGEATFITRCDSRDLRQSIADAGMQVTNLEKTHPNPLDWRVTSQVLQKHSNGWMVLDGYHFDPEYQRQVKKGGLPLLVIDDTAHLEQYHADIVLNQNIDADLLRYSSEPNTLLLLGTQYVLLRPEFLSRGASSKTIPEIARKVLITLGGADADNQTLKVIKAVKQIDIDGFEAVVVVGANNPHQPQLQVESRDATFPIEIVANATNMDELMAWADLAVSGGGSTCWEMAFMGLPALVIILADNQRSVAEGLDEAGIFVNLGYHNNLNATDIAQALLKLATETDARTEMSQRGRVLVDGKGNDRVVSELLARCSN